MKKYIISIGIITLALGVLVSTAQTGVTQSPVANYTFSNDLSLGSRGSDVEQLQTWLINNGYDIPSVSSGATSKGYFGSQTKTALIALQRSAGLTTNGFFGPLTRQYFNRGGNGNGGGSSDNNGNNNNAAPFRVISPNGGESWQKSTVHNITWTSPYFIRATYVDIKLVPYYQPCTSQICPMAAQSSGVQSMMYPYRMPYIITTNISVNQNLYSWTVGDGLSLRMGQPGETSYDFGPGIIPDGQYTIQICQTGTSICTSSASPFTIYSNGQPNNNQLVISGIDAPTTLSVGQTGTWTVRARDPLNGMLSYSVTWGDEVQYAVASNAISSSPTVQQATTFTHSYANAGTYTVTFTVRNNSGLQAQTSSTVTVSGSGSISNPPDINIVSPNGGGTWQIGTSQMISVNVTGDSTRIGNTVTAYLVGTNNQQIYLGSFAQGYGVGYRTFNVTVPTNVPIGPYRLLVNLYNGIQQQAYDYSDGYFTVTNSYSYPYVYPTSVSPSICPAGYSCIPNTR